MDIRASVQIFNAYTPKYQAARAFCNAPGCCRLTVRLSGETNMLPTTKEQEQVGVYDNAGLRRGLVSAVLIILAITALCVIAAALVERL